MMDAFNHNAMLSVAGDMFCFFVAPALHFARDALGG